MRKVTIQQIADLVGVSKFAVSRALSGKPGVSAQTRETIFKAAGQLGYFKQYPDLNQHESLEEASSTDSGTILVLFPNIRLQNHDSIYWGPIFDGVSSRLNQRGLDILTLTEPSGETIFGVLNPKAIQGIVTLGLISTSILLEIKRLSIPTVMVDHADPAFHCDTLFVDNFESMRQLTIRLISKGCRKLQFVGNIGFSPSFFDRWLGFRTALEEYEIALEQDPQLIGQEAEEQLAQVIDQTASEASVDAYVCANDFNAMTVIDRLRAQGIDVPGDCEVTGFDNTYAAELDVSILTVDVKKEWLGRRAVDRLLWRVANPTASIEKTLIYADIINRDSVNANKLL